MEPGEPGGFGLGDENVQNEERKTKAVGENEMSNLSKVFIGGNHDNELGKMRTAHADELDYWSVELS